MTTAIRALLDAPGVELQGDDYALAFDLLTHHPHRNEKTTLATPRIRVDTSSAWGNAQLQVENGHGGWTPWSYKSALHGLTMGDAGYDRHEFHRGARVAVRSQIEEFRLSAFAGPTPGTLRHVSTCAVTGDPINFDTAHIDHAPPWEFARIADAFLESRALDPRSIRVAQGILPTEIAIDFAEFHRERAVLRAVSPEANCSLLRRTK